MSVRAMEERLERGEAGASLGHMVAHALGVPVLDAEKGPGPALVRGEDTGAVGAPHDPGLLSGDRALVQLHLALRPAAGSEEIRFPHEPKHPFAGGAHTLEHPQAGPHLAVAFALKGRGLQIAADESEECIIGEVRLLSLIHISEPTR